MFIIHVDVISLSNKEIFSGYNNNVVDAIEVTHKRFYE